MDSVKSRLTDAATSTVPEILSRLGSRLTGLNENEVREQRSHFGKNEITKGKKKSLGRRIAEAFINPFTAISKLLEGKKAEEINALLAGNTCGRRPTSCADQLAKAVME